MLLDFILSAADQHPLPVDTDWYKRKPVKREYPKYRKPRKSKAVSENREKYEKLLDSYKWDSIEFERTFPLNPEDTNCIKKDSALVGITRLVLEPDATIYFRIVTGNEMSKEYKRKAKYDKDGDCYFTLNNRKFYLTGKPAKFLLEV